MTEIQNVVLNAIQDLKAKDINTLDVSSLTSITDKMIIATGTSARHVKAIADHVVEQAKASHCTPIGVEGHKGSEWILIDLGDVVVNIMLSSAREFYNLEKLWAPMQELDAAAIAS